MYVCAHVRAAVDHVRDDLKPYGNRDTQNERRSANARLFEKKRGVTASIKLSWKSAAGLSATHYRMDFDSSNGRRGSMYGSIEIWIPTELYNDHSYSVP